MIDVSVPSAPTSKGSVDSIWPEAIAIKGSYGFAAALGPDLRVLDLSDPSAPVEIATCNAANPMDVALIGDYAYVATFSQGLKQVDISEPRKIDDSSGADVTTTTLSGWKIASSGAYLYIMESGTLYVLDASNPQNVSEISSIPVPGAEDFIVSGQYCYIASGTGGLRIIDLIGQ